MGTFSLSIALSQVSTKMLLNQECLDDSPERLLFLVKGLFMPLGVGSNGSSNPPTLVVHAMRL